MKDRIFHVLQIPADMAKGVALMEISGHQEVRIENFKGLCSYDPMLVRVLASGYMIIVEGNNMQISYYSDVIMKITGKIDSIHFERR